MNYARSIPFYGSPGSILNPISLYVFGYLLWYLVPPLFSENGYYLWVVLLDFSAFIFLLLGFSLSFFIMKPVVSKGINAVTISFNAYKVFLLSVLAVVYGLRIYQFYQEGVISLLHTYASQEGMYVGVKGALSIPLWTMIWYGLLTQKNRGIYYLLLLLELSYIAPSFSKSSIAWLFLSGVLVYIYLNGLTKKQIFKVFVLAVCLFFMLSLYAAVTHASRSSSINGKFDDLSLNFDVDYGKHVSGLFQRLDLHSTAWKVKGYEDVAAELDLRALNALLDRILFVTNDIEHGPGITNDLKFAMNGYVDSKSALVWPRNVLLYHMNDLGFLSIGIFHILLGFMVGVLYFILFDKKLKNYMFVFLYIPVAAQVMFSVDSNVSATLFHFIQLVIALLLPVFVFLFLYFIYIVFTSAATQPSYSQNQSKTRTHNLGPSNRWEEKQYAQ